MSAARTGVAAIPGSPAVPPGRLGTRLAFLDGLRGVALVLMVAVYVAVCLPAFSPDTVNRDDLERPEADRRDQDAGLDAPRR